MIVQALAFAFGMNENMQANRIHPFALQSSIFSNSNMRHDLSVKKISNAYYTLSVYYLLCGIRLLSPAMSPIDPHKNNGVVWVVASNLFFLDPKLSLTYEMLEVFNLAVTVH